MKSLSIDTTVLDQLDWSDPVLKPTQDGEKSVRSAAPSKAFWDLWDEDKDALRDRGIRTRKLDDGSWVVYWWRDPREKHHHRKPNPIKAGCPLKPFKGFKCPTPPGLKYYEFQKAGIEFCLDRHSAFLADQMGTGKSIMTIGVINFCIHSIRNVLIVTKASLKENWRRELAKWLIRPMAIGIAAGRDFPEGANVVIINYDILHLHREKLRDSEWDLVVLDESTAIKNRKARRTQEIIGRIPSKKRQRAGESPLEPIPAKRKLCLSGTPIENRPEEIWTALHYLDPKGWPSFWPFATRYCNLKRTRFGMDSSGASNLGELRERLLGKLMIRRTKAQVLPELPSKTRIVVELEFDGINKFRDRELRLVGNVRDLESRITGEQDPETAFRRAVSNLRGMKFGDDGFVELARIRHEIALKKLPALIECLHDDLQECRKVLIFGHHRDVLEAIAAEFDGSVLITGQTKVELRQHLCDRFQSDDDCRVFVGSTLACGEGLNLTAADLVVFAESQWTPSKLSQAEDRASRIGQKNNVLVKHYIASGTIDAMMIRKAIEKQEVIDAALGI